MADDKDKKPKPATKLDPLAVIFAVILILAVVSAIVERLYSFLTTGNLTFYGYSIEGGWESFKSNLPLFRLISFSISGIFAFSAIVFSQMRGSIWISERKKLFPSGEPEVGEEQVDVKNPMTDRWNNVIAHIESEHPSDWRLAIIEADVMLAELLDKLNLNGDTMGDKLKSVERSDFITLDDAWEAHKIRNQIAHEGSEFLFNQREARRVIDLYRKVFEEFFMI